MGVAEQNMAAVAAGLGVTGKFLSFPPMQLFLPAKTGKHSELLLYIIIQM